MCRTLRALLVLVVALAGLAGNCRGHGIEQLRGELTLHDGRWQASIWIAAWMLYLPEGPSVPAGEPGAVGSAGKAWAGTLSSFEHSQLRDQADEFLHASFWLSLGDLPLDFTCAFPNYARSGPPVFEEDSESNALVRVDLTGTLPPGLTGPLNLHWDNPDDILVLQVKGAGTAGRTAVFRLDMAAPATELLSVGAQGRTTAAQGSTLLDWIVQGFVHIVPKGFDHILFILGLFLLQPKVRPLLWQSSAFTLAHSITLGLAVLGLVKVSPQLIEPLISLSIVYVGVENLWVKELKPWRVALVFGLGLLHGMGFASVMKDLELPRDGALQPLVGFNVGVELGQVSVLAGGFALAGATLLALLGFREIVPSFNVPKHMEFARKLASVAIAGVGAYWTLERIFT